MDSGKHGVAYQLSDAELGAVLDEPGSLPPVDQHLPLLPPSAYHSKQARHNLPLGIKTKERHLMVSPGSNSPGYGHPLMPATQTMVKQNQMSGGSYEIPALTVAPPSVLTTQSTVISVNKNTLGGGTMMNPLEVRVNAFPRPSLSPHPPPPPDASSYHSSGPMYGAAQQPVVAAHSPNRPITSFKSTGSRASPTVPLSPSKSPRWVPVRVPSPVKSAQRAGAAKQWAPTIPTPRTSVQSAYYHNMGAAGDAALTSRNTMSGGSEISSPSALSLPWPPKFGDNGRGAVTGGGDRREVGARVGSRMSPLSVDTSGMGVPCDPIVPHLAPRGHRDVASPVRLPQVGYSPSASPLSLSPYETDKTFQALVSPNILHVPSVSTASAGEALDLSKESATASARPAADTDTTKDLNSNVPTQARSKPSGRPGFNIEQDQPLDLVKNKQGSDSGSSSPSKPQRRESLFKQECSRFESQKSECSRFESKKTRGAPSGPQSRGPSLGANAKDATGLLLSKTAAVLSRSPAATRICTFKPGLGGTTHSNAGGRAPKASHTSGSRPAVEAKRPIAIVSKPIITTTTTRPVPETIHTTTSGSSSFNSLTVSRSEPPKEGSIRKSVISETPSMEGLEEGESRDSSTTSLQIAEERSESLNSWLEDRVDRTVSPSLQDDAAVTPGPASPSSMASSMVGSMASSLSQDSVVDAQFADAPEPGQDDNRVDVTAPAAAAAAAAAAADDDDEDPEFTWDDYLEETESEAVPPTAFRHVEVSLESCFVKGMKLEMANKTPGDTYWVASIVMPCGQLLRLRHHGYGDDGKADFWCDAFSSDIHALGWCQQHGYLLEPPTELKESLGDWKQELIAATKDAVSVPANILQSKAGTAPIDYILQGMRIELQHRHNPSHLWLAKVVENIGGRLLLRYEGAANASYDFWLFYLHHRLHPVGWGRAKGWPYKPPPEIVAERASEAEWQKVIDAALAEAESMPLPSHIFKDEVTKHQFQVGWKLEALHPDNKSYLCPATIAMVTDDYHFVVEIDSVSEGPKVQMCYHGNSAGIYPVNWCSRKGIKLMPPEGWEDKEFVWEGYLRQTNSTAAPDTAFNLVVPEHDFIKNAKLEAVDPEHCGQICVATITDVVEGLLWFHLESSPKIMASHIVDVESQEIFPVGWCDTNNYPLMPPRKSAFTRRSKQTSTPVASVQDTYTQLKQTEGSGWCPKIYFNHRCFSGPFLSKGRIAELPKCVGPGPVALVMKEVLSMLISVAYKSSRVLREIQMEEGVGSAGMHQHVLKAKYKGKSYRATVQLCKTSDQIVQFCRSVCIKLECCPNLFSPHFVNGNCPERCDQLTKTKYTYYYGKKKKKIGRPPGGHSNLENGPRKPGKRGRRRRRYGLYIDRKRPSADSEETNNSEPRDEECDDDANSVTSEVNDQPLAKRYRKRRGYNHFLPPPSTITTRGAKGPKYSFERRTHQKVLLPSNGMKSPRKRVHHDESFMASESQSSYTLREEDILVLDSNPLWWSVDEVVDFLKTTDCANLVRIFKDQEIDGQAFMMLTLPAVQDFMELKLGPAVKLCHEIERVKIAFYEQFA